MEELKHALGVELGAAVTRAAAAEGWPDAAIPEVNWEYPPDPVFGDLSTPISFSLAKLVRRKPRDIAAAIQHALMADPALVEKVEVAGAGYLNIFVARSWWHAIVGRVLSAGQEYGRANLGEGQRVQVEFVSANPTGPLHVGHGRGAVLGDAVASLLTAIGYQVEREFYINDAGTQVRLLGESIWARHLEAAGRPVVFPENGYHGEYVRDLAAQVAALPGLGEMDAAKAIVACAEWGSAILLEEAKADLRDFGVVFDTWFSEKSLFDSGEVAGVLAKLREGGYLYEDGKAVGFRASDFGDEKDRILIRGTGEPTYFTSDIAYHANKIRRGFQRLINIWGADHGGYIPRVKAAIHALGCDPEILQVILLQMVRVLRDGLPAPMSKRIGAVRGAARGGERGGEGRRAFPVPHQALRGAARLRHRGREEAEHGQPGLLRPVRPCPGLQRGAEGRGGRAGWRARGRRPVAPHPAGGDCHIEAHGEIPRDGAGRGAGVRAAPGDHLSARTGRRLPRLLHALQGQRGAGHLREPRRSAMRAWPWSRRFDR